MCVYSHRSRDLRNIESTLRRARRDTIRCRRRRISTLWLLSRRHRRREEEAHDRKPHLQYVHSARTKKRRQERKKVYHPFHPQLPPPSTRGSNIPRRNSGRNLMRPNPCLDLPCPALRFLGRGPGWSGECNACPYLVSENCELAGTFETFRLQDRDACWNILIGCRSGDARSGIDSIDTDRRRCLVLPGTFTFTFTI